MNDKISLLALAGHTPWRFTTVADARAGGTALSCLQINDSLPLCDIVHPGLCTWISFKGTATAEKVYTSLSLLSFLLIFFIRLRVYIGSGGRTNHLNFTTKILRMPQVWLPSSCMMCTFTTTWLQNYLFICLKVTWYDYGNVQMTGNICLTIVSHLYVHMYTYVLCACVDGPPT